MSNTEEKQDVAAEGGDGSPVSTRKLMEIVKKATGSVPEPSPLKKPSEPFLIRQAAVRVVPERDGEHINDTHAVDRVNTKYRPKSIPETGTCRPDTLVVPR